MRLFSINTDLDSLWAVMPDFAFGTTSKALSPVAQRWFLEFANHLCGADSGVRGTEVAKNFYWFIDPKTTYEERKALIEKYCRGCERNAIDNTKDIELIDSGDCDGVELLSASAYPDIFRQYEGKRRNNYISEYKAAYESNNASFEESCDDSVTFEQTKVKFKEFQEVIELFDFENLAVLISLIYLGVKDQDLSMQGISKVSLQAILKKYESQGLSKVIKDILSVPKGIDFILEEAHMRECSGAV